MWISKIEKEAKTPIFVHGKTVKAQFVSVIVCWDLTEKLYLDFSSFYVTYSEDWARKFKYILRSFISSEAKEVQAPENQHKIEGLKKANAQLLITESNKGIQLSQCENVNFLR